MKFLVLFLIALSLTIAWQSHARADFQPDSGVADARAVPEESQEAGREESHEVDCD